MRLHEDNEVFAELVAVTAETIGLPQVYVEKDCLEQPLAGAPIFSQFKDWRSPLDATYTGVFSDLVYGDLPTMSDIEETFDFIRENLK